MIGNSFYLFHHLLRNASKNVSFFVNAKDPDSVSAYS